MLQKRARLVPDKIVRRRVEAVAGPLSLKPMPLYMILNHKSHVAKRERQKLLQNQPIAPLTIYAYSLVVQMGVPEELLANFGQVLEGIGFDRAVLPRVDELVLLEHKQLAEMVPEYFVGLPCFDQHPFIIPAHVPYQHRLQRVLYLPDNDGDLI